MTSKVHLPTRDATLSLLLKEGELSATNLASSTGISVQAMRRHLRSLQSAGLVESISISLGPGRPSNLWHLTQEGQNRFNTGKGSEQYAIELLDSLSSNFSDNSLKKLFNYQAIQKAVIYKKEIGPGEVSVRLQKLVEIRNREGNMAECHPSSDGSLSWYLSALHCSIRAIAEKSPVVCDQELQVIKYIFSDCDVQRVEWRINNAQACGFKITPSLENNGKCKSA